MATVLHIHAAENFCATALGPGKRKQIPRWIRLGNLRGLNPLSGNYTAKPSVLSSVNHLVTHAIVAHMKVPSHDLVNLFLSVKSTRSFNHACNNFL